MSGANEHFSEEQKRKQEEFLLRARKGLLEHLNTQGGELSLGDLHDFSFKKFFIQHQGFSRLMESLVDENLVAYDSLTQTATITPQGKQFLGQ
jgi:hypothetical protein